MLKLVGITKDYKTDNDVVNALKGIDIEFRKNEFVSILGQSGCGKTTLLNIIGGLDKYTSGDLIIDGMSTKEYKDKDWDSYRNHHIGFVFQSYNLISHLTVLANVELALTISGISKKERRERASKVLEIVGLKDQINKKPNQLSGGQMQRVAIARALVNNPSIILADEPTGALDTKTSIQIMEILKEISKDRLVIMVTHNPELANTYSTRIINLLDGEVTHDSKPYKAREKKKEVIKRNKTSMNFFTALSLSLKNLFTKKTRTILTSIAGSIGIIGIALVLSLSNGLTSYINKIQGDTLGSYPITISTANMDMQSMMESMMSMNVKEGEKFPTVNKVFVDILDEKFKINTKPNNITKEYIDYLENIDKSLINGIQYNDSLDMYIKINNTYVKVNGSDYNRYFSEMIDNLDYISTQYDVLEGKLPSNENEILLVVDQYNKVSDFFLKSIGIVDFNEDVNKDYSVDFNTFLNMDVTFYSNQDIYKANSSGGFDRAIKEDKSISPIKSLSSNRSTYYITLSETGYISLDNKGIKTKIVGVVRAKENTSMGMLSSNIIYTRALKEKIIELNRVSEFNEYVKTNGVVKVNPGYDVSKTEETIVINNIYEKRFGIDEIPSSINIYPKDFESKAKVLEYLDNYNVNKNEVDKIKYTDTMAIMIDMLNTMIKTITYVLVAFTSISLVVSSIMIAIITYVSVIERTKEIGVLRAIGSRKKDISRVFNAETFIIGFTAGVFGVVVTLILNVPINNIVNGLLDMPIGNIASLNLIHAIILIIISIVLTLISGFIPSKIAARKDPVVALRSE